MNQSYYDVLVIGAGPVGLYTGYYCGLRKLKTVICDSLEYAGGQLYNLYPEKAIYDLPGFESITAKEFVVKLMNQINRVKEHVDFALGNTVEHIQKNGQGMFEIQTNLTTIYAKTIIIASGNGSFKPRTMNLNNEDKYQNIHYFVSKLNDFKDQDVVIFGGGDSAVDWSLMLENIAKSVTIVHRRDQFRAKQAMVDNLYASKVKVLTSYVPSELVGDEPKVSSVIIEHVTTKEKMTLKADSIIASYGVIISNGYLNHWDAQLHQGKVIVNQQYQTNIPGVFACGDACYYPGKETQIAAGLGEGLTASASAYRYLFPDAKSTSIR